MKILMVCLGNICRSPMADGLLRAKVQKEGLNVIVDSAGTGGWHAGEAPDPRMQETGAKNGVPIDFLRARKFSVTDFDEFDQIYVMDSSNYNDVIAIARSEKDKEKVEKILNLIYPSENRNVPDPYYGGAKGFQDVFDMLDKATDEIIRQLKIDE